MKKLDEIDWQIVDFLLRDARKSFASMGKTLGIGKDTIHRRYKKLQEEGILGTPTVILDAAKCGFKGIVDLLIRTTQEKEQEARTQLEKLPYVAMTMKGIGDYNLYVSSFFREFEDISLIINSVKKTEGILSYEFVIYSKDTPSPILIPFVEGAPERSIFYKLREKSKP